MHLLKTKQNFIFLSDKIRVSPVYRNQELKYTMHEQGMMQQQGMPMTDMWETLNDDQKKILMKRMLDGNIMMKEGMIKHFQFKIETMKMIKKKCWINAKTGIFQIFFLFIFLRFYTVFFIVHEHPALKYHLG